MFCNRIPSARNSKRGSILPMSIMKKRSTFGTNQADEQGGPNNNRPEDTSPEPEADQGEPNISFARSGVDDPDGEVRFRENPKVYEFHQSVEKEEEESTTRKILNLLGGIILSLAIVCVVVVPLAMNATNKENTVTFIYYQVASDDYQNTKILETRIIQVLKYRHILFIQIVSIEL